MNKARADFARVPKGALAGCEQTQVLSTVPSLPRITPQLCSWWWRAFLCFRRALLVRAQDEGLESWATVVPRSLSVATEGTRRAGRPQG